MIKLTEILNEETPIYKDWDEFVRPDYIIIHLKNGKKIKVDKTRVKGGKAAYMAILKAFNDNNYKITNRIVAAMVDRLGEDVSEAKYAIENINEGKLNAYISSNDGKTFTIYNSNKKKVKNVSKQELEKLMRVGNNYSSTMNWNEFMAKFDKTTNYGKNWKYWKGNLINVAIPSITENLRKDGKKVYGGSGAKEGMALVGKAGLQKILDFSKKNPKNVLLVKDDNYTKFGPYYVKNGKVAKYTVANSNYDFDKNPVRGVKVSNDSILQFTIVESVNEGKKRFYQQDNIGSSKYTISYHDGKEKHKDGSDFYGIKIFKNKTELEKFKKDLLRKGYREDSGYQKESVNEGVRISLFDPNKNKILKTLSVDRNYREAEKEVETLNKRLSTSQKNKGYYWKVTTIGESVNEGKWSNIMKGVRGGSQRGPWTIVVFDSGKKVIHQQPVDVRDAIPAHYEDIKRKFPNRKLSIEDNSGMIVYKESVSKKPTIKEGDCGCGGVKTSNPYSLKEFAINESKYNFGKVEYTAKNMGPVEIQDLAFAYHQAPITKLAGKNIDHRIRTARDLARLVGRTPINPNDKSKDPALLLYLYKSKLVTMDEYKELYNGLLDKLKKISKYVKNADPSTRKDAAVAKMAARADMKREF